MNEAGCFNDIRILNEVLKIAKQKTGLEAIQLDISKCFDTVPHKTIEDAFTEKGISEYVTFFLFFFLEVY
jgi:methylthioribose-1-phosphate isomerase